MPTSSAAGSKSRGPWRAATRLQDGSSRGGPLRPLPCSGRVPLSSRKEHRQDAGAVAPGEWIWEAARLLRIRVTAAVVNVDRLARDHLGRGDVGQHLEEGGCARRRETGAADEQAGSRSEQLRNGGSVVVSASTTLIPVDLRFGREVEVPPAVTVLPCDSAAVRRRVVAHPKGPVPPSSTARRIEVTLDDRGSWQRPGDTGRPLCDPAGLPSFEVAAGEVTAIVFGHHSIGLDRAPRVVP